MPGETGWQKDWERLTIQDWKEVMTMIEKIRKLLIKFKLKIS